MFTGLIESVGTVLRVNDGAQGRRFRLAPGTPGFSAAELALGESVACDGCCLTVVATYAPEPGSSPQGAFDVEVSPETLSRTTLGEWQPGRAVNLERAMRADGRFGGHIVLGHVDGVGRIVDRAQVGDFTELWIEVPAELMRYVVEKGSIAADGISLTVNAVDDARARIRFTLIPHTLQHTSWGLRPVGARVHLEADALAKHVERLLAVGTLQDRSSPVRL